MGYQGGAITLPLLLIPSWVWAAFRLAVCPQLGEVGVCPELGKVRVCSELEFCSHGRLQKR